MSSIDKPKGLGQAADLRALGGPLGLGHRLDFAARNAGEEGKLRRKLHVVGGDVFAYEPLDCRLIEGQFASLLGTEQRAEVLGTNVRQGVPAPHYGQRGQQRSLHIFGPPVPNHLGTFDGLRKRSSAGYDQPGSIAQAVISLAAVCLLIFGVAVFTGAM